MKEQIKTYIKKNKIFLICLVLVILIRIFIFDITQVVGDSMLPTYHNNNILFLNKISYIFSPPQLGDIVVSKININNKKVLIIKRILGTPNDVIEIKKGIVYINGKEHKGQYKVKLDDTDISSYKIPKDTYFLIGDNRQNSYDSRFIGPINKKHIIGKISFKII